MHTHTFTFMFVCKGTNMCTNTCVPALFLGCQAPCFMRQTLILAWTRFKSRLASQVHLRDLSVDLFSTSESGYKWMQPYSVFSFYKCKFWGWNSSPRVYIASTLLPELSPASMFLVSWLGRALERSALSWHQWTVAVSHVCMKILGILSTGLH